MEWRILRQPPAGVSRQLDHVSLIEIGNAMVIVADQTRGSNQTSSNARRLTYLSVGALSSSPQCSLQYVGVSLSYRNDRKAVPCQRGIAIDIASVDENDLALRPYSFDSPVAVT